MRKKLRGALFHGGVRIFLLLIGVLICYIGCEPLSSGEILIQNCRSEIEQFHVYILSANETAPANGECNDQVFQAKITKSPDGQVEFQNGGNFDIPIPKDGERLLFRFFKQGVPPHCEVCKSSDNLITCALQGPAWCQPKEPTPEQTPEEPTFTPEPVQDAAPEAKPEPQPEPTPEPQPEPQPELTPEPTPEPVIEVEPEPVEPKCTEDKECKNGQVCTGDAAGPGKCVPCSTAHPCRSGDFTCVNGKCIAGGCNTYLDCRRGLTCHQNVCKKCKTTVIPCPKRNNKPMTCAEPGCIECGIGKLQCENDLVCSRGWCVECTSDKQCTNKTKPTCFKEKCVRVTCRVTADCKEGTVCTSGLCRPCGVDAQCGTGRICGVGSKRCRTGCRKTADCPKGKVCFDTICKSKVP